MKRRAVTAGELLARLERDPEFQRTKREREAAMAIVAERLGKDEAMLVWEVREAGIEIGSVYDFVNTSEEYPEAVPVLVRHLDVPHEPRIREGVIRALTIKYGGPAVEQALLRHFYAEADSEMRWVLANALKVAMPLARRKKHPQIQEVYRPRQRPKSVQPTPGSVTPRAIE